MPKQNESTESLLIYIQSTMNIIKEMIDDIRDDSKKIDQIESKLQSISDVQFLASMLENNDKSVINKIYDIEHQLEEMNDRINTSTNDSKTKREKTIYILKLFMVALPGIISLIMAIIELISK